MTVVAMRLENFMAFRDSGWISLDPITMLLGSNSSGKSSVIRALRLLKQSLETPQKNGLLTFTTEEGIDLGAFRNIAHLQAITYEEGTKEEKKHRQIRYPEIFFDFRFSMSGLVNELLRSLAIITNDSSVETYLDFGIGVIWNKDHATTELKRIYVRLSNGENDECIDLIRAIRLDPSIARINDYEWWVRSDVFFLQEMKLLSVLLKKGFIPEIYLSGERNDDFEVVSKIAKELGSELYEFLYTIYYVGPIRPAPRRIYALDNIDYLKWQKSWLSGFLDFLTGNLDYAQMIAIDSWMKHLELCDSVNISKGGYNGPALLAELLVTTGKKVKSQNIMEMGYGLSQVLPVIITSVLAPPNSLVIIEEPEIHLHPRAQARLADMFISLINEEVLDNVSNQKINKNVRFLLETHSEHVFLRLRRCTAETSVGFISDPALEISTDRYKVYFINQNSKLISQTSLLQVNDLGEIIQPPKEFYSFFATDLEEVSELTKAQIFARQQSRRK